MMTMRMNISWSDRHEGPRRNPTRRAGVHTVDLTKDSLDVGLLDSISSADRNPMSARPIFTIIERHQELVERESSATLATSDTYITSARPKNLSDHARVSVPYSSTRSGR